MAKGQHLSSYQRGIVNRYYENIDTISLNKLGEIVSDLYLADTQKKTDSLWERAEKALRKVDPDDKKTSKIVKSRDLKGLAEFVNALSGKKS